nr:hypothetical protein [Streptomyces coryli]
MVAGVFHFGVFLVDGGAWAGPVSWRKPTTFGLSFGLTLISVAWVTSYLRMGERARNWLLGIFAADCVVEVGGITLQAWRGVPSHFNRETGFNSAVATNADGQEAGYDVGGFLKLVHGVSMHGVLVLPVLAWVVGRLAWGEERRLRVVAVAAGAYGVAILAALGVSLAGA